MDKELFELSSRVHTELGWETGDWLTSTENGNIPKYNSDFVLEKLPPFKKLQNKKQVKHYLRLNKSEYGYTAYYSPSVSSDWEDVSSTALIALLKLCLALSEAGELEKSNG